MIRARDAFYSGLDKGDPCHWRDVGPDEIWETAWRAAWNLRQQAPDGMVIVPKEPTNEMLEAGEETFVPTYTGTPVSSPSLVWSAMLSASPKPEDVK